MKAIGKIFLIFILVFILINFSVSGRDKKENEAVVFLTWMSNTNWLMDVGNTRILLDGWITRIPPPPRSDITRPETLSVPPVQPDAVAVRRVMDALDIDKKLDYILSGHSHFDHSFDTAVWARLTGAKIIGPKSTCLQAIAQGIPASQCQTVEGGEILILTERLSVRVIKWNHTGNPSIPLGLLLQTPMELIDVPKPDPATGGFKPGPWDQFPHGGIKAYLFKLKTSKGKITWLYANSGNHHTFSQPATIDGAFLKKYKLTLENLAIIPEKKSLKENLLFAKTAEKLDGIDLFIGYHGTDHVAQVIGILKPKAFIPHHWDGVWSSFFKGLQRTFTKPSLKGLMEREKIHFLPQQQYMDKYKLGTGGVWKVSNRRVKKKLGFSDPEEGSK